MPLADFEIDAWAQAGGVDPYNPANLNPASLDLVLGFGYIDLYTHQKFPTATEFTLYPRSLRISIHNLIADMLHLRRKPTIVLATTHERICIPRDMAAEIKLKTTPCREGLGHPTADWVDPGFEGQITLMMHAFKPIRLVAGRRICQIILHQIEPVVMGYEQRSGHYMHQEGPTESWRYKDDRSRHDESD